MSWDIFVQDIPPDTQSVRDISDDYEPRPIGSRQSIIAAIQRIVPGAEFRDPSWGTLEGPTYSIEVNIGEQDPVTSFAFHVRGGDQAAYVVQDILRELGLRAFDPSSPSGIFDLASGSLDGLRKWREYRDSVVRGEGT